MPDLSKVTSPRIERLGRALADAAVAFAAARHELLILTEMASHADVNAAVRTYTEWHERLEGASAEMYLARLEAHREAAYQEAHASRAPYRGDPAAEGAAAVRADDDARDARKRDSLIALAFHQARESEAAADEQIGGLAPAHMAELHTEALEEDHQRCAQCGKPLTMDPQGDMICTDRKCFLYGGDQRIEFRAHSARYNEMHAEALRIDAQIVESDYMGEQCEICERGLATLKASGIQSRDGICLDCWAEHEKDIAENGGAGNADCLAGPVGSPDDHYSSPNR